MPSTFACTALVALTALAACGHASDETSSPPKPVAGDEAVSPAPQPSHEPSVVTFHTDGGDVAVTVELAIRPREVQRGLMYREHLPPDAGMLFLFKQPKVQTFWMKNTLIPLDMIFVTDDMTVAGVVENAEPRTLTSRTVGVPSQFVVEVNGGWTQAHQVKTGTRVSFEGVDVSRAVVD